VPKFSLKLRSDADLAQLRRHRKREGSVSDPVQESLGVRVLNSAITGDSMALSGGITIGGAQGRGRAFYRPG
jgi:hypothetical protein